MQIEVSPDGKVMCSWFALCENVADGVVTHPVLEYVPTCKRCADKCGLELIPATWEWEIG